MNFFRDGMSHHSPFNESEVCNYCMQSLCACPPFTRYVVENYGTERPEGDSGLNWGSPYQSGEGQEMFEEAEGVDGEMQTEGRDKGKGVMIEEPDEAMEEEDAQPYELDALDVDEPADESYLTPCSGLGKSSTSAGYSSPVTPAFQQDTTADEQTDVNTYQVAPDASPYASTSHVLDQKASLKKMYTKLEAQFEPGLRCQLPSCKTYIDFPSFPSYRTHIKNVHAKDKFCPEPNCGHVTPFASNTDLNRHIASRHGGKKPFVCNRAGCPAPRAKAFSRKDKLKEHDHKYHSNFRCFLCSQNPQHQKWFDTEEELWNHHTVEHSAWPGHF